MTAKTRKRPQRHMTGIRLPRHSGIRALVLLLCVSALVVGGAGPARAAQPQPLTAHPLHVDYAEQRYQLLKRVEDDLPFGYVDTEGIPTIGVGLNLREHGALVLQTLGLDIQQLRVRGDALAEEQRHLGSLQREIQRKHPPGNDETNAFYAAANRILDARRTNPAYQNNNNFTSVEAAAAFRASPSFATGLFRLPSDNGVTSRRLFTLAVDGYYPPVPPGADPVYKEGIEATLDKWLDRTGVGNRHPVLRSRTNHERIALFSLTFNSRTFKRDQPDTPAWNDAGLPTVLGRKLITALRNDDRAEAWYEIRYNSGGPAARRYLEADTFGLYDDVSYDDPSTGNDRDAKRALRVNQRHRATMQAWDGIWENPVRGGLPTARNWGRALGVTVRTRTEHLRPARDHLVGRYVTRPLSRIVDGDVVVGETDGQGPDGVDTRYLRGTDRDILFGSGRRDLVLGGSGNDLIDGRGGDDVLYGEAGDDVYHARSGDGRDVVVDTAGVNRVMVNDVPVSLLVRTADDPPGRYRTRDGAVTAALDGGGLVLSDSAGERLELKDYAAANFALRLWQLPEPPPVAGCADYSAGDDDVRYSPDFPNSLCIRSGEGNDYVFTGRTGDHLVLGPATGSGRDDDIGGGERGDDIVEGGYGSDIASGGAGDDKVFGGTAPDLDTAGTQPSAPAGRDRDWLMAGSGDDLAVGSGGENALFGGAGDDAILGGGGDDNLLGDATYGANDIAWSAPEEPGTHVRTFRDSTGELTDTSPDAVGRDSLSGGEGRDWLIGGAGDDAVDGGAGDDFVDGDAYNTPPALRGNDTLTGGADDDTMVGNGGEDILLGGAGRDTLTGDAGDLQPSFHGADLLDGGAGDNDTLFGLDGEDVLTGGPGLGDSLDGGAGNDTYLFSRGDEQDVVVEAGGRDTLLFGAGIAPDAVTVSRSGQNLVLSVAGSADRVVVRDWFRAASHRIELVQFADGALWSETDLDRLAGKVINTAGGYGDDGTDTTYLVHLGPSVAAGFSVTIDDPAGADRLVFEPYPVPAPPGLPPAFVRPRWDTTTDDGSDLVLHLTLVNDISRPGQPPVRGTVRIADFWGDGRVEELTLDGLSYSLVHPDTVTPAPDPNAGAPDVYAPASRVLLTMSFSGHTYTPLLPDRAYGNVTGSLLTGSTGRDQIRADDHRYVNADRSAFIPLGHRPTEIRGYDGDDLLTAGRLADVLVGGPGSDQLYGHAGNDTYVFHRGDGQDTINELGVGAGGVDTLRFGPGIAPSEVTPYRLPDDGVNLYVRIDGTDDRITIHSWMIDENVELILFADGTQWNKETIGARVRHATDGDDIINGSEGADSIDGQGGDDVVRGRGGDDTLRGGMGNDRVFGDAGNDTVHGDDGWDTLYGGSGNDMIHTGASPTYDYAYGGDGDDTLYGGAGIDSLDGDAGNDHIDAGAAHSASLSGGAGDDTLLGSPGNDQLIAGTGTDHVDGRGGDDRIWAEGQVTIVISRGGGFDEVGIGSDPGTPPGTIAFGAGITPQDLRVAWNAGQLADDNQFPGELWVSVGGGDGFFTRDNSGGSDFRLTRFRFADGTEWTLDQIKALDQDPGPVGVRFGTDGDDIMRGSRLGRGVVESRAGNDLLLGGEHSDSLDGGPGDDILAGRANRTIGDGQPETLAGGDGSDVYLYNPGDSRQGIGWHGAGRDADLISDAADTLGCPTGIDTLSLGNGIRPQDLDAYLVVEANESWSYSRLVLRIRGTDQEIQIEWLTNDNGEILDQRIERVQFLGGTSDRVIDLAGLVQARWDQLPHVADGAANPTAVPLFRVQDLADFDITAQAGFAGGSAAHSYATTGDVTP